MTDKRPTAGFEERLRRALERGPRPMTGRGLGAALREAYPSLRGTSDSGVRHYAEGNVRNPRTELLRAMADVLGVRADWLAFNEGAMTQAEQDIGAGAGGEEGVLERRRAVGAALAAGVFGATTDDVDERLDGRAWETLLRWWTYARVSRLVRECHLDADARDARDLELARDVGSAAVAPLRAIGIDPANLARADLETYLVMVEPTFTFAHHLQTELAR